ELGIYRSRFGGRFSLRGADLSFFRLLCNDSTNFLFSRARSRSRSRSRFVCFRVDGSPVGGGGVDALGFVMALITIPNSEFQIPNSEFTSPSILHPRTARCRSRTTRRPTPGKRPRPPA